MRLDGGILGEHVARLVGHGQAERAGRHRLHPERRQQLLHLAQLAGIVGGDDDLTGQGTMHIKFSRQTMSFPAEAQRRGRESTRMLGVTDPLPAFGRRG